MEIDRTHPPGRDTRLDTGARLGAPLSVLLRLVAFALVWVVLVGPDALSWIVGGPFVVAATLASLHLSAREASSLVPLESLRFVPYFLSESVKGGVDVATRVLQPRLRVNPGHADYVVRLRGAAARLVFIDAISLLPGTLSADLEGNRLTVHALDITTDIASDLADLEQRIAGVFGETLEPLSIGADTADTDLDRGQRG